jgi:hypothetical protein
VFKCKLLERTFEPTKQKDAENLTMGFNSSYWLPCIGVVKPRKMRWEVYATQKMKAIHVYKDLTGKSQNKRSFKRLNSIYGCINDSLTNK